MEPVLLSCKAVRLARYHLVLTRPYWFSTITILSFMCLKMLPGIFALKPSLHWPACIFLDLPRITPLFHDEGHDICEFSTHEESPWLSKMKKALLWWINQVSWHPWTESIYCLWLMYVLSFCIVANDSLAQILLLCSGKACRQNLTVKLRQKPVIYDTLMSQQNKQCPIRKCAQSWSRLMDKE